MRVMDDGRRVGEDVRDFAADALAWFGLGVPVVVVWAAIVGAIWWGVTH